MVLEQDGIYLTIPSRYKCLHIYRCKSFKFMDRCSNKKTKRFKYSNRIFFLNFILRFFHKKKYFLYPNSSHYKFVQEHYNKKEYNHLLSNFPKELIFNKKNKSFILGKEKIINKITRYKGKIIGYFPTWRDDGREFTT